MIHKHSQSIHISAVIQVLACPLPTWAQCPHCFTWTGIHTNTHILWRSSCGDKSRWWGGLSNSGTRRHTHVIPSVIERVCKWTTIELVVHRNMKQQWIGAVTEIRGQMVRARVCVYSWCVWLFSVHLSACVQYSCEDSCVCVEPWVVHLWLRIPQPSVHMRTHQSSLLNWSKLRPGEKDPFHWPNGRRSEVCVGPFKCSKQPPPGCLKGDWS